ncbi:MAG: FG-GAP-like repeat-containing protein [Bacteroidota bacterium]
MKQNLQEVYTWTLEKYKKYKSRFNKNVASGRFESFSRKKQSLILKRISKLKKRLGQLKLQLKLGVAATTFSIALSATSVNGQQLGPFVENEAINPIRSVAIAGERQMVAFADMDADGDQDALIGDITGQLKYYRNVGSTTNPFFQEVVVAALNPFNSIAVPSNATPVLIDFDDDGDADLVLGQFDGYNNIGVSYYENDDFDDDGVIGNSPTFTERSSPGDPLDGVSASKYNVKPELVDIDNDGDFDVFLGQNDDDSPYDGALLFFENDSGFARDNLPAGLDEFESGSFSGLTFTSPTFEDIDLDGDQDLFIGTFGGTIRFFENLDDSDGTIGNDPNFVERIGTLNPFDGVDVGTVAKLTFVDLDGDTDRDLVVGNGFSDDPPNYFENTPSGFEELRRLKNPFGAFDVTYDASPTFVDIDNDGDLDAVIGTKYRDDLSYLENNDGTFTDLTETGTPFDNLTQDPDASASPAFARLDTDGDFDLILGLYYDPAVRLLRNTGTPENPAFSNEGDPFSISVVSGSDSSPTLGDITGDGIIDAVVGFDNQGAMRFFEGTSNAPAFVEMSGTQNPLDGFNLGTVGQSRYAKPDLVDLDFDGDLDLVVGLHGYSGEAYDGTLFYLENDGSGNFTELSGSLNPFLGIEAAPTGSEIGDSEPAFADIDQDGDLDLFLGNADGRVQYFENQNQPPIVNSNTSMVTYTVGDNPIILDNVINIFDDGNDIIQYINVQITDNFEAGIDYLDVDTGGTGIVPLYDDQTGILNLSGLASLADYQNVLSTISFENLGGDPQSVFKTVTYIPVDFDNTDPFSDSNPELTIDIEVIQVNDPPVLSSVNQGVNATYVQNTSPIAVDDQIEIIDTDDVNLEGATVIISAFQIGDVLLFEDQNGITGIFEEGSLVLSGSATVAQYQTALRSVSYQTSNDNLTETIQFQVDDGQDESNLYERIIDITPPDNVPPTVGTVDATTQVGSVITLDLCQIISDTDNSFEELTISVLSTTSGAATSIDGCELTLDYVGLSFEGQDNIQLEACDPLNACNVNTLSIIVQAVSEFQVYNAVSPNNDGRNDWWIIEGLTSPNNIRIFNRWGDEVKELNNYVGSSGVPNNELDDLIAGTYFYQIESPQGSFNGYLTIKK